MNDVLDYIRVILPRYTEAGQAKVMHVHSIRYVQEGGKHGNGTRSDLLRMVRPDTMVAIQHLFLLADPKAKRKRGGTRADLWRAIDDIERRGGSIWELYTGLRSDTREGRDAMTRAAIEALARGRHKTSAADKRGRPSKEFSAAEMRQAHDAWHSRKLKRWRDVKEKFPNGFTVGRAYKLWGKRT